MRPEVVVWDERAPRTKPLGLVLQVVPMRPNRRVGRRTTALVATGLIGVGALLGFALAVCIL